MNLTDMYLNYLKERENKSVIVKDYGFISYEIKDKEIIADVIYIKPECRGSKLAWDLEVSFLSVAKEANCTKASCDVYLDHSHAKDNLGVMLTAGYIPVKADKNIIRLSKEIK